MCPLVVTQHGLLPKEATKGPGFVEAENRKAKSHKRLFMDSIKKDGDAEKSSRS